MICVSISSEQDLEQAFELGDVVELRTDLGKFDIKRVNEIKRKPIIVTNRKGDLDILNEAIQVGVDYVDVDLELGEEKIKSLLENKKNTKIIISYHNYEETPEDLFMVYDNIIRYDPDIIKIVTTANELSDNLRIFDLIKMWDKEIIAFCMGEKGQLSRILSPVYGGFLTLGCLEGKETAPGQIGALLLRDVYRVNELNEETKVLGIIGNPLKYSKGKVMHNLEFKKTGLNYVYLPFLTDEIRDTMHVLRKLSVIGGSVTMPCKQEIMKDLDEIHPVAAKIGAVNTIVHKEGKLIGYNADWVGAVKALETKTEISGKHVVILGAGGAARAVAYGVRGKGGVITILNRTVEKARQIAEEFGCDYGGLDKLGLLKIDILINTTSVGMGSEESLVDRELLKDMVVMDVIYTPMKTRLLIDAEENGCTIISGIEMYLHQGAEQFKLWTGREPPMEFMREKVMELD